MTIARRLEDAKILYDADRHEGALLSVLIAAAATSRLRHPHKKIGDREAFESFLRTSPLIRGRALPLNGECVPLESVLYKFFRCTLAHEGTLPPEIVFKSGGTDHIASIGPHCDQSGRIEVTHSMVLVIGHLV